MKIEELQKKVDGEVAKFSHLNNVSPEGVEGFMDAVEIKAERDVRDVSEVIRRAAAVRYCVRKYPWLYLQFRQKLMREALRTKSEEKQISQAAAKQREEYSRFLHEPLIEEVMTDEI